MMQQSQIMAFLAQTGIDVNTYNFTTLSNGRSAWPGITSIDPSISNIIYSVLQELMTDGNISLEDAQDIWREIIIELTRRQVEDSTSFGLPIVYRATDFVDRLYKRDDDSASIPLEI